MVLMTEERIAARDALYATYNALSARTQDYQTYSREERVAAAAEMKTLESSIQVFVALETAQAKLAEVMPYFQLYQGLKPDAVALIAQGIDELLDVIVQVGNSVTKYQEVREAMACSSYATYQAYMSVGFSEQQAFACTIRSMEIFDEAMRKSMSNVKVPTK